MERITIKGVTYECTQIIADCIPWVYEPSVKTTRTKLPRKLKKKNKKIGRVNLSVSYVAKTYAKNITVNLGF